ncbi:MAG: DUF1801 domain-containing protein [Acidobacteriaceae bacterium]|nr:DUF1801 domain-containing protein [Acidobacteriaceae bacterium]
MRRAPGPELLEFLTAYDAHVVDLALRLREVVLEAAPEATEMVYDMYEALAMTYTMSGRLKEAFCHMALYREHVNLGFNYGARLPDPRRLLQGTGKQIRHLRVSTSADLEDPNLHSFLGEAIRFSDSLGGPMKANRPKTIVKECVGAKRRP